MQVIRIPLSIAAHALILTLVLVVGCYPRFDQPDQLGPNARVGLLIFFNEDITNQQIQSFWDEKLMVADTEGGYLMTDGVCGIALSVAVESHESLSVDFCSGSTESQRENLKAILHDSPFVFKVFEDAIPREIKTLR